MTKFLTTYEATAKIEKVIRDAKNEITLVTPFLKLSGHFISRLKDADSQGITIKLIYGKKDLVEEEYEFLTQLKNLQLFFCENLHAKCYFNEEMMVITSLNLYEYSIKNNREMGVLIKKEKDPILYQEAVKEVNSIIQDSIQEDKKDSFKDEKSKFEQISSGFCIRRGEIIPFNPNHPLCRYCYDVWVQYGDVYYPEIFCHKCGEKSKVSYHKPLCKNCYYSK